MCNLAPKEFCMVPNQSEICICNPDSVVIYEGSENIAPCVAINYCQFAAINHFSFPMYSNATEKSFPEYLIHFLSQALINEFASEYV